MKLKFAVCLICLFLFVAAIDNIPDPPALSPATSTSVIFHAHARVSALSASPRREGLIALNFIWSTQADRFPLSVKFDDGLARIDQFPLIRHATDSSPPRFL